jgi:hypothetical protein
MVLIAYASTNCRYLHCDYDMKHQMIMRGMTFNEKIIETKEFGPY